MRNFPLPAKTSRRCIRRRGVDMARVVEFPFVFAPLPPFRYSCFNAVSSEGEIVVFVLFTGRRISQREEKLPWNSLWKSDC